MKGILTLKHRLILILFFTNCLIYSKNNQFNYNGGYAGSETISLQTKPELIESIDGFSRLAEEGEGHTTILGMPELPSYSTLFQIDPQTKYRFEIEIVESYTIDNISILPYQGVDKSWHISEIKNQNFKYYISSESFPAENLWVSDRIPGRGFELVNLQVIPYKYHPKRKQLEVYSEVAVLIIEEGENPQNDLRQP